MCKQFKVLVVRAGLRMSVVPCSRPPSLVLSIRHSSKPLLIRSTPITTPNAHFHYFQALINPQTKSSPPYHTRLPKQYHKIHCMLEWARSQLWCYMFLPLSPIVYTDLSSIIVHTAYSHAGTCSDTMMAHENTNCETRDMSKDLTSKLLSSSSSVYSVSASAAPAPALQ